VRVGSLLERLNGKSQIHELLRISLEVRIFPLLKLDGELSPYIESVIQTFSSHGFDVKVQPVAYEFQKGANQILKIMTRVSG